MLFLHYGIFRWLSGKEHACQCRNLWSCEVAMDGCLGWEDPLEEEMATHASIFAMKIPWTEESAVLWSVGLLRVRQE